jgi:hypothetical protein
VSVGFSVIFFRLKILSKSTWHTEDGANVETGGVGRISWASKVPLANWVAFVAVSDRAWTKKSFGNSARKPMQEMLKCI